MIEVALAIGVLAVGLLAIMGLFPQGLKAGREAADNTIAASIVQDLLSQIRNGSFSNTNTLSICTDPPNCGKTVSIPLAGPFPGVGPLTATLTFDQDGYITNTATASVPNTAYYRVLLTWQPQPSVNPNLLLVKATISWPAQTAAIPPNASTFITEVAWYSK